jgi:hypothetical protein
MLRNKLLAVGTTGIQKENLNFCRSAFIIFLNASAILPFGLFISFREHSEHILKGISS